MIHPSYVDLMNVVNKGVEEGETPVINSRYSIVMATAKRARQIVDGDDPLIVAAPGKKPLSIAVEELNQEILPEDEKAEEREEAEALRQALRQCTEFSSIDKDAVAEEEGIENIDEDEEDAADADADAAEED